MPEQRDLVSLILNLSAHERKSGKILPKDQEIEEAVSELVANAEQAVPLLIEALDYSAFYKNYEGPRWHVPYNECCLHTYILGIENVRKTLREIGDKAKPDLIKHLEDKNDTIMHGSLQCLLAMGEARTILQDKTKDGSLARPNFIPVLAYVLGGEFGLRDQPLQKNEVRQMAYEAVVVIKEKYPKLSFPYLKRHFYRLVHGIDNPVEILEMAADIFTEKETLMLKLSRCKKEERRAIAMELAQTGTEAAVQALTEMADGVRLYSTRKRLVSFRKPEYSYGLTEQLDAIDALGETGSQKALRYLQRLAKYQKGKKYKRAHYRDESLAWEEIRGSVLFPHAKRELKKRLETRTITLERVAGPKYTGILPGPNWAENYLARNDIYQRILSSVEKLKRGPQAN